MGRVGPALDNAASESFHSVLKVEYVHRHTFRTRAEARLKTATWIADFYNTKRRHGALAGNHPSSSNGSSRKREPGPIRKAGPHNQRPYENWGLTRVWQNFEVTKSSETQDLVIVTGASTGMGAATARELARRGFHVLAGVRRDSDGDALVADGIEPVILDITDQDHIRALVARVDDDPQGRVLRALVNNAGIPGAGPVEAMPLDEWRRLFEVNVFGHIAMTQALLPGLVRSKGRIVNITSLNGKLSMAGYGPYASTKFAMEAVSDALRNEVAPYGVQVVVVEPGGVKTKLADHGTAALNRLSARMPQEQSARYGDLMKALPSHIAAFTKAGMTSDAAGRTIAKAVTDRKPRTRYTIGAMATFLIRASRFLPDRMLDRMTTSDLHKHYPART